MAKISIINPEDNTSFDIDVDIYYNGTMPQYRKWNLQFSTQKRKNNGDSIPNIIIKDIKSKSITKVVMETSKEILESLNSP